MDFLFGLKTLAKLDPPNQICLWNIYLFNWTKVADEKDKTSKKKKKNLSCYARWNRYKTAMIGQVM